MCAGIETCQGLLAIAVGDAEAAASGTTPRAVELLRHDTQPQHSIPIRTPGRPTGRRRRAGSRTPGANCAAPPTTGSRSAPAATPGRCSPPAPRAEADGARPPTGDAARGQVLDGSGPPRATLPRPTPLCEAYALLVDAETARAEGRAGARAVGGGAQAASSRRSGRSNSAEVRYRHAEALLARGTDARETRPAGRSTAAALAARPRRAALARASSPPAAPRSRCRPPRRPARG